MQHIRLPGGCQLRPATAPDIWAIRKLVFLAMLDPTQLRWSQFWVIEREQAIVACGQLRQFQTVQELGSLVVAPDWRGQGLGTHLTQHLIDIATQPVYLECIGDRLASFYARFGFVPVHWQDLPRPLQFKFGLSTLAQRVLHIPVHLMKLP